MAKGTILVIDDQRELVDLVRYNLERESYRVISAASGEAGLAAASSEGPDLILLDRAMPGLDGLEVCRRLRKGERTASVPILLLTGRATEAERVAGLEAGADDYITKPFSPRELAARIKAALRRAAIKPVSFDITEVGALVIDAGRHRVTFQGKPVPLTAAEFRILRFLASRPGRVFKRSEIIEGALGGHVEGMSRTIDVHLAAIRRKLGPGGRRVETVRGVGYRLAEGERESVSRRG